MSDFTIPRSFPRKYRVVFPLLALLVVVSGIEPTLSVTPSASLATTCTTLTPSVAAVLSGGSGTVRFTCGVDASLTVSRAGLVSPVFTLPTGYTALTIVDQASDGTTCIPGHPLASRVAFDFTQPGSFDYCALYSNAPASGLASFTLTWMKAVPKGDD